ncbi:hypothetical protein [Citreimonas sp.]|uniref:hypothetical protein n=1 Tax=Citreimonas sp. TaxID=3036715 RepID=UPI004059A174
MGLRTALPGLPHPGVMDAVRRALSFLPHTLVVLAACLGVWALKKVDFFSGADPSLHLSLLAVLLVALAPLRAAQVDPALRVVMRVVTWLFAFYALAAWPVVTETYLSQSRWGAPLLVWAGPIAVAAAVLATWRPGFGLVPVMLVAWKKHELARLFGFPLNATDYYPVAELGLYLTLGAGLAAVGARLSRGRGARDWSLGEAVFLGGFAIHLANYFWSAVEKTLLPGAGLTGWITGNETVNIMLATQSVGLGPLMAWPWLAEMSRLGMEAAWPVTNALTFAAQALALVAVLRVRWGIWLTVFYDLMHLGIFLTTSILFWKWMTLNAGLVAALAVIRHNRTGPRRGLPPWPMGLMGVAIILLAPLIFNVARLGWWDSAAINRASVVAVTEDGREVPVPLAFFLEGSAELAKSRVGQPFEGHFHEIGAFGKARLGRDQMNGAAACDLPVADQSGLAESFARNPALERFFRQHHAFALRIAGEDGTFPYFLFPHHNWSTPSLYREFAALDLREIRAYVYRIDSLCLGLSPDGGLTETLRLRGSHVIALD